MAARYLPLLYLPGGAGAGDGVAGANAGPSKTRITWVACLQRGREQGRQGMLDRLARKAEYQHSYQRLVGRHGKGAQTTMLLGKRQGGLNNGIASTPRREHSGQAGRG